MRYTIQIHLEHKTDVIRDIEIPAEKSLKDLHDIIIDSLRLEKNEMASFYKTNEEFELLYEIPLFKIDDKDSSMLDMNEITIASVLSKTSRQLIYVYDFMKMWRFLVSYSKETDNKSKTIEVIKSIGNMPEEAPNIIFESDKEFEEEADKLDDYPY